MKRIHLTICFIFLTVILVLTNNVLTASQSHLKTGGQWKGNAILGNGNLCAVYSDDPRIEAISKGKGIQHLYYQNYTGDYVSSAFFNLYDTNGNILTGKSSTGLKDFFSTLTETQLNNNVTEDVTCFAHPGDAVVMTLTAEGRFKDYKQSFNLYLRKNIITDRTTTLTSLKKENNYAVAQWSSNTVLIAACMEPGSSIELKDSIITISGKVQPGEKINVLIIPAESLPEAENKLALLKKINNLYASASKYWVDWIRNGKLPEFKNDFKDKNVYLNFYKRTLYSVKAADLNGQIPADITGQFLTNSMPQLYPRDAMMCARIFLMTGHPDEAKQIINFWTSREIPLKSKGEFYARYDAYAKAVDAGSGARYNEPEWDANGYLIQLLNEYHDKTKIWLADKNFIYEIADFLVRSIDNSGLLYEGGIIEWTGYLPATNMTCSAALKTASKIANEFGDVKKASEYLNASNTITASLYKTYDKKRNSYVDLRFHGVKAADNSSISAPTNDTLYLWDTSINFGIIWGYPDNIEMKNSNDFILKNTVILNGGVQYFESQDNGGLSDYGSCAFFFTTAASAEYQSLYGNKETAKKEIDWMIKNSNVYSLMPERIYSNGSDCSEASPLSWCNAEFAASVYTWSKSISK